MSEETKMTRTISISEAKTHLSELVGRMMYAGEQVIIERHGKAVAAMIPIEDYMEFEQQRRTKGGGHQDGQQEVFSGINPK
jgi:prevent-host-death family protein